MVAVRGGVVVRRKGGGGDEIGIEGACFDLDVFEDRKDGEIGVKRENGMVLLLLVVGVLEVVVRVFVVLLLVVLIFEYYCLSTIARGRDSATAPRSVATCIGVAALW